MRVVTECLARCCGAASDVYRRLMTDVCVQCIYTHTCVCVPEIGSECFQQTWNGVHRSRKVP